MPEAAAYPTTAIARDRFVVERRGSRPQHDPWRYQGVLVETERAGDGAIARVATVFLTGRECPWRCAMCDLWKYTTATDTPPGAITSQLRAAREAVADQAVAGIKLYNASNFFDPRAVPEADYDGIAATLAGLSRVIVESHPSLVGPRVDRFNGALARHRTAAEPAARLEVAIGLETVHPEALDQLNKRVTLEQFEAAARALELRGIGLRVFLLILPPFVPAAEQDEWLSRSIEASIEYGASAISLIPTRPGNGTLEALAMTGSFAAPDLNDVERSFAIALSQARGRARVFVDLWDLERLAHCADCFGPRRDRLQAMNLQQTQLPSHVCPAEHRATLQ
jgi:radical SAM enzyme (TIGR01210 family)